MRCTRTTPPSAITTRSRLKWSPCHCRHRRSRSVWRSTTPTCAIPRVSLCGQTPGGYRSDIPTACGSNWIISQDAGSHCSPKRPSMLEDMPISCASVITMPRIWELDPRCSHAPRCPLRISTGKPRCRKRSPCMSVRSQCTRPGPLGSPIAAKRVQYRDMHWESSTWHPRMGRQHEPKVPNTNQRSEEWKEPASSPGIGTSKW